ncbi:hypothetical protein V1477_011290 [Vespula maculifrons]|uniref:Uncharacterized protein n=1 Tax=Vespula maculifrons TaxID=7453 RepID=A0ABD2C4D1_VESMC
MRERAHLGETARHFSFPTGNPDSAPFREQDVKFPCPATNDGRSDLLKIHGVPSPFTSENNISHKELFSEGILRIYFGDRTAV